MIRWWSRTRWLSDYHSGIILHCPQPSAARRHHHPQPGGARTAAFREGLSSQNSAWSGTWDSWDLKLESSGEFSGEVMEVMECYGMLWMLWMLWIFWYILDVHVALVVPAQQCRCVVFYISSENHDIYNRRIPANSEGGSPTSHPFRSAILGFVLLLTIFTASLIWATLSNKVASAGFTSNLLSALQDLQVILP
jgi:hypothetical protein